MRARSGTMPSSSSSKMVRRYISVVSIRSVTVIASPSVARLTTPLADGRDLRLADHPAPVGRGPAPTTPALRRHGGRCRCSCSTRALWDPAGPARRRLAGRLAARPDATHYDGALVVRHGARPRCVPAAGARGRRGQRPRQRRLRALRPAPRRAGRQALAATRRAGRTGTPYAVAPGHADATATARRTRSSPPSPGPGARTAGPRPAAAPRDLRWAARRRPRGPARGPDDGVPGLPPAGEAARRSSAGTRSSTSGSTTTPSAATAPTWPAPRRLSAAPEVRRGPPAHAAGRPRRAPAPAARAAAFRDRAGLARVLRRRALAPARRRRGRDLSRSCRR